MTPEEVARLALRYFPDTLVQTPRGAVSLPAVMVAIAGAESAGWNEAARGDPVGRVQPQRYPPCEGYYSWGLWQINIGANLPTVAALGAPNDPCGAARWLLNPENNARAARAIYDRQGLGAWSAWRNGSYLRYLDRSVAAVRAVQEVPPPLPPRQEVIVLPSPALSPWRLALGLGLLGAGLAGLIAWYLTRPRAVAFARRGPGRIRQETLGRFTVPVERYRLPGAELVEHATEPMTVADLARNLRQRLEERGVRIIVRDIPAPETGGGMILAHYHRTDTGQDIITLSSAVASTLDTPFGFSVLVHEAVHALLHNPDCWPQATRSHEREEMDTELATVAALAELELPIETYEGIVYPPGSIQVNWEEVRAFDPTAYRNVRWAADWVVRAARGEDHELAVEPCPALKELMRR